MEEVVKITLKPNGSILSRRDREYLRELFSRLVALPHVSYTEVTYSRERNGDRVAEAFWRVEEESSGGGNAFRVALRILPGNLARITGYFCDGSSTILLETETFFVMRGLIGFYEALARIARQKAKAQKEREAELRRKTLRIVGAAA